MIAPVVASGCWPAWIARVAKRWRCDSAMALFLHPSAEPVQEVDRGDEAEKRVAIHDDGDHPAVEDLGEPFDRRVRWDGDEALRHRRSDRLAEMIGILEHLQQDVLLVDDARDAARAHHRQL